jgi:hypothetical protein
MVQAGRVSEHFKLQHSCVESRRFSEGLKEEFRATDG